MQFALCTILKKNAEASPDHANEIFLYGLSYASRIQDENFQREAFFRIAQTLAEMP
jgi:hypothetical protein